MVKFVACILLLVAGCALTDAGTVSENVDAAFIRLYNRNGPYVDVSLANVSLLVPLLNENEKLTCYIHGLGDNVDKDTVTLVVDALVNYTTDNVIALDYRNISTLSYPTAVAQVQVLCAAVVKSIQKLVDSGVKAESIYIIGASLGAELAGCIGRNLSFKLERITGLDPAGPLFYIQYRHLSASDAKFVDIIHTDAGMLGLAIPTGTVDFFPNFGHGPQPGCNLDINILNTALCSHQRSFRFFVESLKYPRAFIGVKCDNELFYRSGACNGNERAVMGYHASPETRGKYFLRTSANEPYGLGAAGAPFRSTSS